ncbi:Facilitated trehalose transporter Tret1 [Frankliniella fusca]|uniref:Facilitated trehalose transporter Tret1 n=1 Tax=Frankliniella fusca TaxID=407009 RepID=A0AAE1H069_9NEOP|nr:Facilitated trehalose transporter Tret1 [Frankliniella fusca]
MDIAKHPAWLPGRSPQFVATIVVNLVAFSFGCACGWPSVAGPVLSALGCSDEALSWVAAVVWPAGLVGAALFGPLTERLGRRLSALFVAVPLTTGWLLLVLPELWVAMDDVVAHAAAANSSAPASTAEVSVLLDDGVDKVLMCVLAGRAALGVGMGGVLIVCPMYVGEVVEDALRGQLGSYMPLFINAGILYVYALGAQVGWSALALLCAAFPVAFLALFALMPETPMYLLSRGDERGAVSAITWLRDPRRGDLDGELGALRASVKRGDADAADGGGAVSARDLVATRGARRGLVIVLGLLALQQFSGITAILNYAASIFDMAGSTLQPEVAAVVVAGVQLVGSVAACGLADSLGRLPLLYASYGSMAASLGLLGACFCWPGLLPGWVPVACLSFYILMYAVGAGPGPFLLLVEVFPAQLRALASQTGLAALFTLAFVVSKFFSTLSDALGAAGCFWLFAACCVVGVVFIRLAIPETKGRAVDDIVAALEGGAPPPPRKTSSMV